MCWQNTPRSARTRRGRPPSSPASSPTWATIPISPRWRWQNQADDGELFAGAGIRGRRHRRRHFGARAFRSLWRGALPDRDGTQRRDESRQDLARSALAGFSVVASGDARARAERAGQCAAIHLAGGRRARPRDLSRRHRQHRLRRRPQRGIRSRPPLPASQTRLHLPGAGSLHAGQYRAGGDRRARRRQPGDALRRGAGAGRADARRLSQFRLDGKRRQGLDRGSSPSTAFRRRPRPPTAINGNSGSTRCASAATSTASFSPPNRRPPRANATPAKPSLPSAA